MTTNSIPSLYHKTAPPTQSPCSNARTVLTDSTNNPFRSCGVGAAYPQIPKKVIYPAPSARILAGPNVVNCPPPRILASSLRSHRTPLPLFPVACKAPPTVSVSLSAASSRDRERPHDVMEVDFPDVRNIVPFPCSAPGDQSDVEMLDGTYIPLAPDPCTSLDTTPVPAPLGRKRRSACSSVSQSNPVKKDKDSKDGSQAGSARKRARKSKRHVADLSWLEIVHRSIMCGIEIRQTAAGSCHSIGSSSVTTSLISFQELDKMLAERLRKRLVDGGCREGRDVPSPLPRISSPTMSMPTLLPSPSVPCFPAPTSVAGNTSMSADDEYLCPSSPVSSPLAKPSPALGVPIPSSNPTFQKPHVRFQNTPHPHPHPSTTLRRSPSPPPRTRASTHGHTLTLTMPQLVAVLILSHRERSGARGRGRRWKEKTTPDAGKRVNSDADLPASQETPRRPHAVRPGSVGFENGASRRPPLDDAARLMCAPERKSPLSRVAYVES
ncbi:hypothetical protein F5I97DRAFT_1850136 [Phlebopus sp. FC_14]|nr:hypothetical protein F5I97DRAFT_1850136 [Phlebopus sp. FC_14]